MITFKAFLAEEDEYSLSIVKNKGGETPWKDDVESNTVARLMKDGKIITFVVGNIMDGNFEVEFAQTQDAERKKGMYTRLLDMLSREYNVISDVTINNAAQSIYKKLGAHEKRGRFILKRK